MRESKCSPLVAGVLGFVLGALVVKLVERFCPFCGCRDQGDEGCCGEADCCCDESEASSQGCCCAEAADAPSDGEAGAPAE